GSGRAARCRDQIRPAMNQTSTPDQPADVGPPVGRGDVLRELTAVSRTLSSLLSPQDILEEVADAALRFSDAELAAVLTRDAAANVCRVAAGAGERRPPALAVGATLALDSHPWLTASL